MTEYPIRSSRCIICHEPATNNHHHPPKGEVGDHDQTITLCGFGNANGCHGLAHHNGGTLKLFPGETWHFVADKKAAEAISRRRKRHSLPKVREGFRYAVVPVEACEGLDALPDEPSEVAAQSRYGEEEHELAAAYAEVASADYTVFRCRAERLAMARDWFRKNRSDADFREWRLSLTDSEGNPIPVTDKAASEMLTVVDNLPDGIARSLPVSRQVLLARAVRDGVGKVDDLLPHAESLTARAFEEEFLGREPYSPPSGLCPECGHTAPLADFKEAS